MRTKLTPKASAAGEYNPFDDSGDSDSTDADSSGTERLPEYSVSSIMPGEPLLPEDEPMNGTTTYPRSGEDACTGFSLQTSKYIEPGSAGETVSEKRIACGSGSTKAAKETEDKGKDDKASNKSMELAECDVSGGDLGVPENQRDLSTSSSVSVIEGRFQQMMSMGASNTSSEEIGESGWAGAVVENPETQTKTIEEPNKNYDGLSCGRLINQENSDMNQVAGSKYDVFKVSKFRQKLGRAAGRLPGCTSGLSESYAPISENTSISHQPQATATVKEEASMEENSQFAEDEKSEEEPYIAQQQQFCEVGQSVLHPWNPPLAKESSWAGPSFETVKAAVEKTTGSNVHRVSKFRAKLWETKKKGEFPAAIEKVNIVPSVSAQNVQASSRFPTWLRYRICQTESNIEKNIVQPDRGAVNASVVPTLLSEFQTLSHSLRPSVDQISCLTPDNSENKNVTQLLNLETNILDVAQAHGEATVQANIAPGYASTIFETGVKHRLKSLQLQEICEDDLKVLTAYCKGWFEAKSNSPIEQVPQESIEKAGRAFKALKDYVDSVEAVFHKYTCLPQGQFSKHVDPLRRSVSKNAPPVFRKIIAKLVKEFANEYKMRNAEIFRQEEEVIKAVIGTAGDYLEEEAAFAIKNDYFEAQPLLALLTQIEEQTKQSFLHACDIKFPAWERKYSEMLDTEVQRRRNKIQSNNERQRLKTQKEMDETVDRLVSEYTQGIQGRLKNLRTLWCSQQEKFQQAHLAVKEKIINKMEAEFSKKWVSCPGLYDAPKKKLEAKIEEVRNKEYESLVTQEAEQKGTAHYNSTTTSYSTYSEKGSYLEDHNQRGITTAKGASKPPAFTELPSLTVAIHMGLRRTTVGVIRPGTKEFQNIAEVDNCLYYRDGGILLAYNDSDKKKLNPQDVNFQGGLVEGPIDQLHEVTLNGERLQLRKEHIISSTLAVLKCKAELELQVKCQHCVIVVPQFLNETQRTCITDAARIADFDGIKIIDDTVSIALEYMMRKQEWEGFFIVTCATEGVVDVAKFHIKGGLLRRLEVSGTHFLHSEQATKGGWRIRSLLSAFTWSREENENILMKIFDSSELNLGQERMDKMLKLFACGTQTLNSIKTLLKGATNFKQVSELNAVTGGAMFAALCEERQNCPLNNAWKLTRPWLRGIKFEDFKTEILSVSEKEKKRSSNPSEGVAMTDEAVHIGKSEGHMRRLKEVHGVALEAVKIIRSLKIAVSGKELKDPSSSELVLQQLTAHELTLQQPNLQLQEAQRIRDELLNTWNEKVLGLSTKVM